MSSAHHSSRNMESRQDGLKRKIEEIKSILAQEDGETTEDVKIPTPGNPIISGATDHALVKFGNGKPDLTVIVGTSRHAEVPGMVDRISSVVHRAYSGAGKRKRLDSHDVMHRLEMGDDGVRANRVLHLAFKGSLEKADNMVGCASSTFQPGWTPEGCGHWGLLAVDPDHQGAGVATALVLAAERRLATTMEMIQIEYEYTAGEEFSERLASWYEDKLGFNGGGNRRSMRPGQCTFRRCFKEIPEAEQRKGHRRRLEEVCTYLTQQLKEIEAGNDQEDDISCSSPSEECV